MSRRATREGQRLAEDVAAVIAARETGSRRPLTRREAQQIKEDDRRHREERRATSMRVLLRRQYMPWIAGLGLLGVGGVEWQLRWLSPDPLLPITVATLTGLCVAWVAWMMGRRQQKWRGELARAAIGAAVWLLFAATKGPSWTAVLLCALLVVVSSSSWWKANRPAHPTGPASVPVPSRQVESAQLLWEQYIGRKGSKTLPGSLLSGQDTSKPNCEVWTIDLVPGEQSYATAVGHLGLIAGGLHTPIKNLVLEPHEDENPNHVKLTIVKNSPIEKTLPYRGARNVGEHRHVIEVGPYGDGDGYAPWRMWQPGEQPMTGSWLSGLVVAGTGIGKSRLMELLAAGYMSTGSAVVWFIDPQGGASSPALQEYADWYVSSEGAGRMIGALEAIAEAREAEMGVEGWSRFDPTPERPGIVVFLDECHVTIGKYGARLEALARKTQKVGIAFVGLTQGASLESLGKDTLRACLLSNLIVMRTNSNQTKNLIPGLTMDPEMLPKIKGFGYSIGTDDGARTAPFRAEYVEKPKEWFARYPMPKLDAMSANATGDVYQMRSADAAKEIEAKRGWVEQLRAGLQPTPAEPTEDEQVQDEPQQGGAFQVAKFPTAPVARPQDKPPWQRIIALVAQGVTRTDEILKASPVGKSQTHALLRKLLEEQHLEQPTKGVYAIAGSASLPER